MKSGDLISRQAAIDAIDDQIKQCNKALCSFDISMKDEYAVKVERASLTAFKEQLEYLPSAEPEPKRGKWIEYEQEFMLEEPFKTVQKTVRECSICTAKIAGMVGIMNFCPNCGAKMEVAE